MTKKPAPAYSSIMLIDDSEIDNFINEKMIEGCNIAERIFVHSNAINALEYLINIDKITVISKTYNLIPQLIFLDINMPCMNGFEFLVEFGKLSESFKDVRVVVLSSSINPVDKKMAMENEYVIDFVNKPLTEDTLYSICPNGGKFILKSRNPKISRNFPFIPNQYGQIPY